MSERNVGLTTEIKKVTGKKEEREEIKKVVEKSNKENQSKLRLLPSLVYQHISVNRVASIELYP